MYELERKIAIEAVSKASKLCIEVQNSLAKDDSIDKLDKSPVTIADFGSQAVVNYILNKNFNKDIFVGEEDSAYLCDSENLALKSKVCEKVKKIIGEISDEEILKTIDLGNLPCDYSKRYWTLDPIDGTKGFLRGDQYAIALGLVENGKVVVGVLGCPNLKSSFLKDDNSELKLGCIFVAVKNEGSFVRGLDDDSETRVKVDKIDLPENTVFCESVESAHTAHSRSSEIAKILGVTAEPYRIDSQCKYGAVAQGDASIYLRLPVKKGYQEKIWDHAAGSIIVEEAGGKVTDINGKLLDFSIGRELLSNKGIIASNGVLHEKILKAVKQTESK
jgi:3'(2'), 5'-bisphosphate nucleotidase